MLSVILINFLSFQLCYLISLKTTQREEAPSNKTPTLTKDIKMDIWLADTSN